MLVTQDQKPDAKPIHGNLGENASDLPPAYDTLSLHEHHWHSTSHGTNQSASTSTFLGPVAEPSSGLPHSDPASLSLAVECVDKSLSPPPPRGDIPSSPRKASSTLTKRPRARKNTSWLSFLPFASTFAAKRVRQSAVSIVHDLVLPPSCTSSEEQKNVHEILASIAETCAEHKVSLSSILQETFIADHTPMYWAVVNYRQDLLVALLDHSRPLSIQTASDIRRACLVSSNQALFHALRVCRPPFHMTDGIQVPSLRTTSDNLLLGNRPLDEIHVQQTSDQAFVISFDIPLWQRRMKAIGQVGIEFIASSRMWSLSFFSTDPSSSIPTAGKTRKDASTWHVMISLMESSPPTFFDSQLVVDVLPPLVSQSTQTPKLREVRSATFPSSNDKPYQNRSSMYDCNYDRRARLRKSCGRNSFTPSGEDNHSSSSSYKLPPPNQPLRHSFSSPPISIHLGCGNRKLGRRAGASEPMESPTMKPDTWSDHGVGYTNAVVSSLGEGLASQLLYDQSRYLLPDGTLRGQLEVQLVKTESSKGCIIC